MCPSPCGFLTDNVAFRTNPVPVTVLVLPSAGWVTGARKMPIRPLLEGEPTAFGPDEITAITVAFDQTLRELRLVDRGDPAVALVARRMIEFAKRGERNPARLREAVLKSLRE
jgi:hypothetical protein